MRPCPSRGAPPQMQRCNVYVDQVHYELLFANCVRSGRAGQADAVLDQLQAMGGELSPRVYHELALAASAEGNAARVRGTHAARCTARRAPDWCIVRSRGVYRVRAVCVRGHRPPSFCSWFKRTTTLSRTRTCSLTCAARCSRRRSERGCPCAARDTPRAHAHTQRRHTRATRPPKGRASTPYRTRLVRCVGVVP